MSAGMPIDQQAKVTAALAAITGACFLEGEPSQKLGDSASGPVAVVPNGDEEMELDDDQVACLAELEVRRQQDGVTSSLEDEFCKEARMAAAKARIRSDFKVRKKGKIH